MNDVKALTDDIAKTGSWEGDQIEGFVVRSIVRDTTGKAVEGKPPYRPGAPFFFKVKFDEPYLLYRQWRETTRTMLPLLKGLPPDKEEAIWKRVRSKTKRPEVGVYAEWCGRMMKEEPQLFEGYERGVVRVRNRFLAWTEVDGAKVWADVKAGTWRMGKGQQIKPDRDGLPKKWMIVPVAVPGCGEHLAYPCDPADILLQERLSWVLPWPISSILAIHKATTSLPSAPHRSSSTISRRSSRRRMSSIRTGRRCRPFALFLC